ncbi:unnamed protein product [Durusdinium trenchii]|uniref:Uncharacterized protein n=2 Tax=Durusdinium trenchii TaxID=1381693 RepID=A0ABP0I3Q1_9DINO
MTRKEEQMEMALATTIYCLVSSGMMLSNKLAIRDFPLECSLVWVQLFFTAVFLVAFALPYVHIGSYRDFFRWSLVAPMYTGMLLTSILALKNAPMSLVIVLRNASPLGTLIFERFYPDPLRVSWMMLLSMMCMLAGAMIYMSDRPEPFNWRGVWWVVLNSALAVVDRLLQRLLLSKDQYPVDISNSGITLINNVIGMVPVGFVVIMNGELNALPAAVAHLDGWGKMNIFITCVLGLAISYTSIWAQSLITATSFLVMTNANKFLIIIFEAWGGMFGMSNVQVLGASMTIVGCIVYGKARKDIEMEGERSQLLPTKCG